MPSTGTGAAGTGTTLQRSGSSISSTSILKSPRPANSRTISRLSNLTSVKSPPRSPLANQLQLHLSPPDSPQTFIRKNPPRPTSSFTTSPAMSRKTSNNSSQQDHPRPRASKTTSLSGRPPAGSTNTKTPNGLALALPLPPSTPSSQKLIRPPLSSSTITRPPNSLANLIPPNEPSSTNDMSSLFEEEDPLGGLSMNSIADPDLDDGAENPSSAVLKTSQPAGLEPSAEISTAASQPQDNPPRSPSALIFNSLSNPVSNRAYEELLTKYKLMEQRRVEDKEKLREFEKVRDENEQWSSVVKPKFQARIDQLQDELKALKKSNKELEISRQEIETRLADFSDEVELATLDKEMAEEKLDQTESLLVGLKDQLEAAQVELTSLKEIHARIEAGDDADNPSDQATSLKLIQLEKQNSRLKEALARMRDLAQESEAVSRKRIADLEQELDLSAELQGEYSVLLGQLETAESQVEDLKQQLDASMGVEDMLEQLTERNLTLNEKIDDMRGIIEDLEALKELADELEENHVETEKQMQEEIDFKDMQFREQKKRNETLEESVADYENTILQFRELVISLQTDLDGMRERQQIQQDESQSLASQTQAMLNLNRKLQSSSVKGQVKAIDLELRKLESTQAILQCTIMKPYLLPAYFEGDHDAVESLMFFTRLAAKTELVSSIIEQTNNITECADGTVTEVILIACDTRSKLVRLSAIANRFTAFIRACPPDSFIKMGGVYQDLISAEKKIDAFIEACKKEELKEADVGKEIERYLPQMRHLAEMYMADSEYDVAELQYGDLCTLDVELDSILACITFVMQTLGALDEGAVEDGTDLPELLIRPLQNLLAQARTAKVISKKLLRRLLDLSRQSCSLNPNHSNAITVLKDNTYDLANVSSRMADLVGRYCSELVTTKEVFQLETYQDIIQEATRDIVRQSGRPLEEFFTLLSHLARDLGITLGVATDPDHLARNSFEHPWVARVAEMRSSAAISVDAEVKVLKLKEEIRELVKDIQAKDHSLQESQVKIQVMEKRMEAVKKQTETLGELEQQLKKTDKELKQYEELTESIQNESDKLAEENKELKLKLATTAAANVGAADPDSLRKSRTDDGRPATGPNSATFPLAISGHDFYVPYEGNLETAQLVEQIESLRGAARFLRAENGYLKGQKLLKQLNELPAYSEQAPLGQGGAAGAGGIVGEEVRKLSAESRALYREALRLSATPRVVDLALRHRSSLNPARPAWALKDHHPATQLANRKQEISRLHDKIARFKLRTNVA